MNVNILYQLGSCRPIDAGCVFSNYISVLLYPHDFISLVAVEAIIEGLVLKFFAS